MADNNDAQRELIAENKRLKCLLELNRTLVRSELPLDLRYQELVSVLARLAKAEKCSLMLVEDGRLEVKAATNRGVVGMLAPLEQIAISTAVLRSGQAIYLKDIADSPFAHVGRAGDSSTYRTGSFICLPLCDEGATVGVLNLSDKQGLPHFDQSDLEMAQAMADQVAVLVNFSALHQRLNQAYQDLRDSQRAKDDLMSMLFHDMKAPLTALKEVLKLLAADKLSPTERKRCLDLAGLDMEQLWRRVSNMLDLGRMEGGLMPLRSRPVRLAELAGEVLAGLEGVAALHEVRFQLEARQDLEVVTDEDLVERILVNLLFNALRFSAPENGGGGKTLLRLDGDGRFALLEVRDAGPGVDEAMAPKLFQRYAHGQGNKGSTGLGLYFCQRAAWLLGGEVVHRNSPGGGASFVLSLPLEGAL